MEDRSCSLEGSFIAFAATQAGRGADPRPSLQERYGSKANYVKQVEAAARQLLREGFLLSEDAERLVREARAQSRILSATADAVPHRYGVAPEGPPLNARSVA